MSNFFKRVTPLMGKPTTFQELEPGKCCVDDIFLENAAIALNGSTWELTLTLNDDTQLIVPFPSQFTDDIYVTGFDRHPDALSNPAFVNTIRITLSNGTTYDLDLSFLSGSGEDLQATLVLGNTTGGTNITMTTGDILNASSGNSQIDLSYGGSPSEITINTDNGNLLESFITMSPTLNEIGFGDVYMRLNATGYNFITALAVKTGVAINPTDMQLASITDVGGITSDTGAILVMTTGTTSAEGQGGNDAVIINSGSSGNKTSYNNSVNRSVALGGEGITVKTSDTAYANQISLQQVNNTFDALLQPSATTSDRTYVLPDRSGNVHIEDPLHVHVYQASDIPAALVTDTTYIIHGTITTSNTILVANQNTAIIGYNRDSDKLVYTGTGAFINVLDADFFINNLTLTATDPASLVIDARNYTAAAFNEGRTKVLHITNSQFRDCYNVCDFEGFDLIDIENTLFWYIKAPTIGVRYLNTSKIEITSCEFIRWFDETTIPSPSGWATCPMFEIQPNGAGVGVGAVNISASLFHPQQTQDGIKLDNASTTNFGTIASNTFINVGLTTGVVGNFDYDIQNTYIIQANQGIENGNAKGILSLTGNLIELNNSAAPGPPHSVVVNDANFVGGAGPTNPITFPLSRRVITSVSNASFTYDSKINGNFFVNLNATVGINANGTYTITIQFRQNGISLPFLGKATIRNSGGVFVGQTISLALQGIATQGDVFDVLVSCDTANNVLLSELLINGYQF